ncbi:MAG: hypothetical protein JKY52_14855 [Flavobacteriales bacterium]|nr:hypothetical protein [Flavobacteriales bacterium]
MVAFALWLATVLLQLGLEIMGRRHPSRLKAVVGIQYKLELYLKSPLLVMVLISAVILFNADNLQFPTYNIMLLSQAFALSAGAIGFIHVKRRKLLEPGTDIERLQQLSQQVFTSLLLIFPAMLIVMVTEFHIRTNWITDVLNSFGV